MVVSFSGSRSNSVISSAVSACLVAILSSISRTANVVGCGCCPSGVDFFVQQFVQLQNLTWRLFSVNGNRSAAKLRERTLSMVRASQVLFSFPKTSSYVRSGTWLATFAAFSANKQVFVFLPNVDPSFLPLVRGIDSWVLVSGDSLQIPVPGFSFWVPKGVSQTNIFNS